MVMARFPSPRRGEVLHPLTLNTPGRIAHKNGSEA
ncbi:hypothetical protein M2330_001527 [Sphingobium sp. B10D3B]|nr:hypothetical protein [Sphingobium sp. B10D3B]